MFFPPLHPAHSSFLEKEMANVGIVVDPVVTAAAVAPQTYLGYKTPKNVLTYVLKAGMAKAEASVAHTLLLVQTLLGAEFPLGSSSITEPGINAQGVAAGMYVGAGGLAAVGAAAGFTNMGSTELNSVKCFMLARRSWVSVIGNCTLAALLLLFFSYFARVRASR